MNRDKSRNLQKAVYNVRLTVMCGIITILVLRGAVGTGMFSASDTPSTLDGGMARSDPDLDKEYDDMINEDPPIDPSIPFQLGLNITNWDETRGDWLRTHQNMTKNKFGKDRVLLVSGSASKPCKHPVGDHMLVKSLKNKIDYTRYVSSLSAFQFSLFTQH